MKAEINGIEFPWAVTPGSVTVRIYRIRRPLGYTYYQVRYYTDGRRKAKTCSDLAKAEKQAAAIAAELHRGGSRVVNLRGRDCSAYFQARAALDPIQIRLELAATEYRLCHDLLAGRASVLEAVRHFAESRVETITPKLVLEILDELLEVRAREGVSKVHLKDLGNRLGRFAKAFSCPLSTISGTQIHDFILAQDVGARTRNNFRTAISNLVNFARQRRYVPRHFNPMAEVSVAKKIRKPVEVFTTDEMSRMLQNARPTLVPFLYLIAFGGLRHEEAARIDWADYTNGHIRDSSRNRQAPRAAPSVRPAQPGSVARAFQEVIWLSPAVRKRHE